MPLHGAWGAAYAHDSMAACHLLSHPIPIHLRRQLVFHTKQRPTKRTGLRPVLLPRPFSHDASYSANGLCSLSCSRSVRHSMIMRLHAIFCAGPSIVSDSNEHTLTFWWATCAFSCGYGGYTLRLDARHILLARDRLLLWSTVCFGATGNDLRAALGSATQALRAFFDPQLGVAAECAVGRRLRPRQALFLALICACR